MATFPSGKTGAASAMAEPDLGPQPASTAARSRRRGAQAARRQQRPPTSVARPARGRGTSGRSTATGVGRRRGAGRPPDPVSLAGVSAARSVCGERAGGGLRRGRSRAPGRSRPAVAWTGRGGGRKRRCSRFDRPGTFGSGTPQNDVRRRRLPQQDADRPHVAGMDASSPRSAPARCNASVPARPHRRQRVGLVELRQAEIEQPHRTAPGRPRAARSPASRPGARFPSRARARTVEDLRRRLDGLAVVHAPERMASRTSCPGRTRTRCTRGRRRRRSRRRVRSGEAQPGGRRSPRARRERRVCPRGARSFSATSRPLRSSARQPDRAGAASAERAQRPVAVEDELALRQRIGRRRHGLSHFAAPGKGPAATGPCRKVAPLPGTCREV